MTFKKNINPEEEEQKLKQELKKIEQKITSATRMQPRIEDMPELNKLKNQKATLLRQINGEN